MTLWPRRFGTQQDLARARPEVRATEAERERSERMKQELGTAAPGQTPTPAETPGPGYPGRSRVRMALLVAASALGGGIAVVLYNRRLLARLREPRAAAPEPASSFWDDHD